MESRRSYIKVKYAGTDITGDISAYLKSFTYTDNLDKGDTISLSLLGDKWIKEWVILKGDKLEVEIGVINWKKEGDNRILKCGVFSIDDIAFSGVPDTIKISAISIDISKDIKGVKKDKIWHNISLKRIAQDIANDASMELFYDCKDISIYSQVEQVKESDLQLLSRICKENGASLKISLEKIIIFQEDEYENKEPLIHLDKSDLINYELQCEDIDRYDGCEVTFYDPALGELLEGKFEAPESELYGIKTGKIMYENIDTSVTGTTKEEKESFLVGKAKNMLRDKNKNETKIKVSDMGDPSYLAGNTVKVTGFGIYDDIYLITSVTHTIDPGYKCNFEIRKKVNF
ncbi:hypothetical protein [Psychrilyobacter sp.]|uniref:phage late control D family protein n=1 Tax=Psychrilyobacter sp. TaxID=2586924 RepID=UPI003019AE3A